MTLREGGDEARRRGETALPAGDAAPTAPLLPLIREYLDAGCGFSIGCLGAIAEFHDAGAALEVGANSVSAVSARGALRIRLRGDEMALAYESLAAADDAWQCGIAVLAPRGQGRGPARTVLTEIGADGDAVRACDRNAILFDLGVGMPNVDYCVRTADPLLLAALRRHAGQAVIGAGHPLQDVIIEASPHRVAMSGRGRIEVFQPIDRHQTPTGPHTHLLPALLARRRTHSANIPLPGHSLPLLSLHPENPLFDDLGRRRPFVRAAFERFETTLAAHGLPEYAGEKRRLREAVSAGGDAAAYRPLRSRVGRLAMRIALRQLLHAPPPRGDVEHWLACHRR